jgi:hypothetical protein
MCCSARRNTCLRSLRYAPDRGDRRVKTMRAKGTCDPHCPGRARSTGSSGRAGSTGGPGQATAASMLQIRSESKALAAHRVRVEGSLHVLKAVLFPRGFGSRPARFQHTMYNFPHFLSQEEAAEHQPPRCPTEHRTKRQGQAFRLTQNNK